MSYAHMFDTANPPPYAPPGYQAVAGYIGGNTPHVWTLAEWRRFEHLRQLPIWVLYGQSGPEARAREAVHDAHLWGFKTHALFRRAIVNDFETEVDPGMVNAFADEVKKLGYITVTYGSLGFIRTNHRAGGYYWGADYNGVERLPGVQFVAEQYAGNVPFAGTSVDLSVISRRFLRHLGRGPRKSR